MSSKWFVLMAVCLLMAISIGTAQAYPQLAAGATGLAATPTAYVIGARTFDLAVDFNEGSHRVVGGFRAFPIRLVAGVSDNAELGIAYLALDHKLTGVPTSRITGIGGKWQWRQETEGGPATAVGINYTQAKTGGVTGKLWSLYLVASKKLTEEEVGLTGNFGVAWDSWNWPGANQDFLTPFMGLELGAPGGTTLGLDYKWKQRKAGATWSESLFGAVVRHPINEDLSAEVGMTNATGNIALLSTSNRFFLGVKYQFGSGQEEEF